MQPAVEPNIRVKRRVIVVLMILPLFTGSVAFMNLLGDPHFQAIRNLDVVRLTAVGACWGVSAAGLAMFIGSKLRMS